jgi:hypothetical protein
MKTLRVRVPRARPPFFVVGQELYLDLLWNWGHGLTVEADAILAFIAGARPGELVVGRLLSRDEGALLVDGRRSSDSETYAQIITTDDKRWRSRRR